MGEMWINDWKIVPADQSIDRAVNNTYHYVAPPWSITEMPREGVLSFNVNVARQKRGDYPDKLSRPAGDRHYYICVLLAV